MNIFFKYKVNGSVLTLFLSALIVFSAISEGSNRKVTNKYYVMAGAGVVSVAAVASIVYFYSKKIKTDQPAEKVAIIIDFDRCLMKANFCYPHRTTPIDQVYISEKDFGLQSPRTELNSLLDSGRVSLAIASFGRKDIINKALDLVIDEEHRDKIIVKTPQDVGGRDWYLPSPANKNKMIAQIAQETGIPYHRTILFDDTKQNIDAAKNMGVRAQHAEPFDENSLNIAKGFIR